MRFNSPSKAAIAPRTFDGPAFSDHADWRDLLAGDEWPDTTRLNQRLAPLVHRITRKPLAFVDQAIAESDGRHYEERIHAAGHIATRAQNWHDLFNAFAWKRCPEIKSALNQRQVDDLAAVGARTRTRAQHALTHFDEAGIVVVLRDLALLPAWDGHDWAAVFLDHREAWRDGRIQTLLVGHAVLEHALDPSMWLVAKALVLDASGRGDSELSVEAIDAVAGAAIANGNWLRDPQELRPLPLSGLPGWHAAAQDAAFYRDAPCFQPRRSDRRYPAPQHWPR